MSASAFRVARVEALRGRYLLPEDEAPGATGAMVIGFDEWVRRFDGDPDIVGRSVRLGGETYEIVGVMPDGFGFPMNHSFWIPWRLDPLAYQPRTGPIVGVFGRLAPGATLETAQAELTELGRRAAADSPATHEHLRPRVHAATCYAYTDMGDPDNFLAMRAIQFALVLLLIIVCVNVAILVYARTATRQGEIAVRGALGASRLRIVAQLFVEALTLAGVAAAIGLFAVLIAMPQLEAAFLAIVGGRLPFWMEFRLKADGVIYVVGADAARRRHRRRAAGAQGHREERAQRPPGAVARQRLADADGTAVDAVDRRAGRADGGADAGGDVLHVGRPAAAHRRCGICEPRVRLGHAARWIDRPRRRRRAATRRSRPDTRRAHRGARRTPARAGAGARRDVFAHSTPDRSSRWSLVAEGSAAADPSPRDYNIVEGSTHRATWCDYNRIAIDFFDAFDVPVILGRDFTPADLGTDHVVVNRTLADTVFGTANPLGRRIKYVGRSREATEDNVAHGTRALARDRRRRSRFSGEPGRS